MLYVACTRAADYLILSSSLEAFDKPKSDWMKLLAERFDLANGELIADLPDGLRGAASPRHDRSANSVQAGRPIARPRPVEDAR